MDTANQGTQNLRELIGKYEALAPIVEEQLQSVLCDHNSPMIYQVAHRIKRPNQSKGSWNANRINILR